MRLLQQTAGRADTQARLQAAAALYSGGKKERSREDLAVRAAPDGLDVEGPRSDQRRRRPRGARQSRHSPAISKRWRAPSPAIARATRSARSIAP